MKNLKNLVNSSVMAVGVLFASSFAANSAVITHDLVSDGNGTIAAGAFGSVTFEIDNMDLNTGILDTAFGDNIMLNEIEIFGFALEPIFMEAVIDSDNIMAGIEAFEIDADDIGFAPEDTWSYQLTFDAFSAGFGLTGFIDVYDFFGDVVAFSAFDLSAADVSDLPVAVSTPATIAIFSLAMGGLYVRRKQLS